MTITCLFVLFPVFLGGLIGSEMQKATVMPNISALFCSKNCERCILAVCYQDCAISSKAHVLIALYQEIDVTPKTESSF